VLFWFRLRRGYTLFIAALVTIVIAVLITLTVAHDALTVPSTWLVLLASLGIYYLIGRSERYSAGADWAGRGSRTWVRTYELVSVKASDVGGKVQVIMKDSGGRTLLYVVKEVFDDDRRIWNYTYNGILHSVIAGGAETNDALHELLGVPYPESAEACPGGSG
jgi:hypothetical protein